MRRILALVICIFLFILPVNAANTASSVRTTAKVNANGACEVTIEADIRLDDPARGLKFPLGKDIQSVTLNGTSAPVTQSEGITSVNLSHLDGKTGLYSCTIRYVVNSVVETTEEGKQIVTVPLLYGFPYTVEDLTFSVTMPSEFDTIPAFHSGYHGQDIERHMSASIVGNAIQGSVVQPLKDSETLFLTLVAPEGMFPAAQTFGGSLTFDAIAMAVLAGLAFLYWLLQLRCLPRYAPRRATAPEGICAGQIPTSLVRSGADLPAMVLQWAQLGYLIIHMDDNGRVFLHKKMDMGNERSTFELRCFRDLFGRKMMLDATGYRFQKTCLKASALSRRQAHGHRSPAAAVQLFRALSALLGAFAGVAMADAVSTHHTWRIVLMAALGIFCMVACWLIQEGMSVLHLRSKASLKLTALLCPIVLLTGYFCGVFLYGLGAVAWNLLAGLLAAYGGRRTENGVRIYTEILGLRRHMRKASPQELQRILASNRNYYFELAPYALLFGLDKSFAEKFGHARLPACTWLVTGVDSRIAPDWYTQLREVYQTMHRERKPTLAERIFGK